MLVQGVLVGPLVKMWGDRKTMIFGLAGGAAGLAAIGLAPTGLAFAIAIVPNALWGFAMPTLQSLMTRRVSEWERSEEHTPELQPLMRSSYACFCLTKNKKMER